MTLNELLLMVERFQKDVLLVDIPSKPLPLSTNRVKARVEHLQEELNEFKASGTLENQADGLIDLIYVALGGLIEMGITPGPIFEVVHAANMQKKKGEVAARPNSEGQDAIKPDDWEAPKLEALLMYNLDQLAALRKMSPIFFQAALLREKKGEDYNDGLCINDYMPFGHASYTQMVYLKGMRLRSLATLIMQGKKPNFDGILDTLLDLINYASFYGEAMGKDGEIEKL